MKPFSLKFPEKLSPYRGVIIFAIVLMISNFFWKYNVFGDEAGSLVTLWGMDISAPFIWMARHVAIVSVSILHFLGWSVSLDSSNVFRHDSGFSVQIIWACTGIKQAYICFCILAFARGPWQKKLWYIPFAILMVYLFNIFRIVFIIGAVDQHPGWFDFLHVKLFKYLFYGIIFGLWVIWEEKIAMKSGKEKE